MKLNRTHALLLVGTIAAAGCVVEDKDNDGNAGEGGEGSGAKGGGGGTAGSGTSGAAGAGKGGAAGKAGSSSTAGKAGASSYAGTSSVAGAAGEAGGSEAGAGGMPSEGGAGGAGGAAECDDEGAVAVTCEGLSSTACDISSFLDDECAMTAQTMKPRVSNLARQCMLDLKASALCDATNTYGCIDTALKAACPDETVKADCDAIIVSCSAEGGPVLSAEDCSSFMSGLNEAGRYQMVSCMTGSSYCDFHTCAEGLTFPSAE